MEKVSIVLESCAGKSNVSILENLYLVDIVRQIVQVNSSLILLFGNISFRLGERGRRRVEGTIIKRRF